MLGQFSLPLPRTGVCPQHPLADSPCSALAALCMARATGAWELGSPPADVHQSEKMITYNGQKPQDVLL